LTSLALLKIQIAAPNVTLGETWQHLLLLLQYWPIIEAVIQFKKLSFYNCCTLSMCNICWMGNVWYHCH